MQKNVYITREEFLHGVVCLGEDRIMDEFTRMALFTLHRLVEDGELDIGSGTGVALSTSTGTVSSLKNIAERIRKEGYRGINPSFFPNVMLSTALSRVAIAGKLHGPSCAFYDEKTDGKDAWEYCKYQILNGNCDSMILICAEEGGNCVGIYMTGADFNESCID